MQVSTFAFQVQQLHIYFFFFFFFVRVCGLRFYGPVNPLGSCRARSVYLITFFFFFFFLVGGGGAGVGGGGGRLSSLSGLPVLVHILSPDTDNQQNDRRKYFVLYLNERNLPCPAGIEPAGSTGGRASNWVTEVEQLPVVLYLPYSI